MSITVIADIQPTPENAEAAKAILLATVARVRAEDAGCERYDLNYEASTGTYVMLEQWASEDALTAHSQSPAFLALGAGLEGLLAAPLNVRTLAPLTN